jgi:DNA-binding protein
MTSEQKNTVLATLRRLSQSASEVEITSRRIAEALEIMRQKLADAD